jgi:opacity protein-like surface antigen
MEIYVSKCLLIVALLFSFSTIGLAYQEKDSELKPRINSDILANKIVDKDNHPNSKPYPLYVSVFGGGGSLFTRKIEQTGLAFNQGSNLNVPVDVSGAGSRNSVGFGGVHVGYKWLDLLKSNEGSRWGLTPATEIEGYYLGGTQRDNLNNNKNKSADYSFKATYPLHNGVFLANAILNINPLDKLKFHPYLGAGVGAALVATSGAESIQTAPEKSSLNYYGSKSNSSDWAFATQAKLGLSLDFTSSSSIFAEYRFLYLAPSQYTLGSTKNQSNIASSSWDIHMGGLYSNMGTLGVRYDL